MSRKRQCKACPWKKSTVPTKDIPGGYCPDKHANLHHTIANPGSLFGGPVLAMACHKTTAGVEDFCVGWAVNQLGPGNNIALRLRASVDPDRFCGLVTIGPQHECFEDTLPKPKRRKRC